MKQHRSKSTILDRKYKIFKPQMARTLWKKIKFPARLKPISSPAPSLSILKHICNLI